MYIDTSVSYKCNVAFIWYKNRLVNGKVNSGDLNTRVK